MTTTIALIEDDVPLRDELRQALQLHGFDVAACDDFASAAQWVRAGAFDCVLLDLRLPQADGLEICRELGCQSTTPVIVITSSEDEFDEVMALNLGADDYLAKPFSRAVLVAHVQAALRRGKPAEGQLGVGGVVLDEARATVGFGGQVAELTRNETRLLHVLMQSPDQIVSRQDLIVALWETDEFIDDNTLTVNMNRLRKKLGCLGVPQGFIATRRGLGYQVCSRP